MMDFKDRPYALVIIGAVVAVLVLGTLWIVSGRAKTLPPTANAPAMSPEQEAMRQAQGESRLGADQGGANRDEGESRR